MNGNMQHHHFERLRSFTLFSSLDDQTLTEMLNKMPIKNLATGDRLFTKGDPSGSLYIVLDGLLAAIVESKNGLRRISGKIHPCEMAGEMGLLSAQPRSVTVEALCPTVVIQLTQDLFNQYFSEHLSEVVKVSKMILHRKDQTYETMQNLKTTKSIFLISANNEVDIGEYLKTLEHYIAESGQKIILVRLTTLKKILNERPQINEYFNEIENDYRLIIYLQDLVDNDLVERAIYRCDSIGIMANGNKPVKLDDDIKNTLMAYHVGLIKKNLILIYHETPKPQYGHQWTKLFRDSSIHHINVKNHADHARFLRLLLGEAYGVLLGGGGARGWTQLGAIKALTELGYPIDYIGGTSVGAMIAGIYLISENDKEAYRLFKKLSDSIGNPYHVSNFTWPLISLLNGKMGTRVLKKIFKTYYIENLTKPFFCLSCNLSEAEQAIHTSGPLWKWVRASSSIPGLVPPVADHGMIYVDGGVVNNLPVDIMRENLGPKGKIIAIDISPVLKSQTYYKFPPVMPFFKSIAIALGFYKSKNYILPSFQNLLLKSLLTGSLKLAKDNVKLATITFQPDLRKFPTLAKLSDQEVHELFMLGYHDVMKRSDDIKQLISNRELHALKID